MTKSMFYVIPVFFFILASSVKLAAEVPASTSLPRFEPVSPTAPLETVITGVEALNEPCRLEGDYRSYYPDNGLRYTRTYESIAIRCENGTLYLGDSETDRRRLVRVSGLEFKVDDPRITWPIHFQFEITDGIVIGLRRTSNGRSVSKLYEFRKTIESHDPVVTRIASKYLQDAVAGDLQADMFTSEYAEELFPDGITEIHALVHGLDRPERFEILKRAEDEDGLQYAFLIVNGDRAMVLHLRFSTDMKIRWAWFDSGMKEDTPNFRAIAERFLRAARSGDFGTDLFALSSPGDNSHKEHTKLTLELKELGDIVALKRTRHLWVNVCYLVVFENGTRTLDLFFAADGRIEGFRLSQP